MRVLTAGKASKGRSVSVAVVDGRMIRVTGADASPTVAQMRAVALGVVAAQGWGATELEITTPSKRVALAVRGLPGGGIDDYDGAHLAGWAVYYASLVPSWTIDVAAAKDVPELAGLVEYAK